MTPAKIVGMLQNYRMVSPSTASIHNYVQLCIIRLRGAKVGPVAKLLTKV